MVLLWHFREEKRILWDHRDALYIHCSVPSEWNINIQRWTVKKYIYLIIVYFLSICTSLHLKDKYHTFHSTTFDQGPRSRKSFLCSFASQWVIFSSLKTWLFRPCISDHSCSAFRPCISDHSCSAFRPCISDHSCSAFRPCISDHSCSAFRPCISDHSCSAFRPCISDHSCSAFRPCISDHSCSAFRPCISDHSCSAFRPCISDHSCSALWSDFTAFFEHWPDADVIFICNNAMTRS